jgi:hypothetical protein
MGSWRRSRLPGAKKLDWLVWTMIDGGDGPSCTTERRNADLEDRVLKLERTVRSIGEVLAMFMGLCAAYLAVLITDWLGFSRGSWMWEWSG